MSRRFLLGVAVPAALSAAAVGLWASPLSAQTGTFRATPTSGPAGTTITISSISPCVPATSTTFARIALSQGSTVLASADFSVSSSGAWTGTLKVPGTAAPGAATLGGDCIASPQAEGSLLHYQDVPFTVTSVSVSGGGTPWVPYVVGVVVLGIAVVALGHLRRRRHRSEATRVAGPG
jgi:hypothetical protein